MPEVELWEDGASATPRPRDAVRRCVTFFKDAHVFVARRSEAFLAELGRHNYVTPTSYLELLATYKQVLALKRDEVGTLKTRLRVGLDKLIATAEQVEDLQVKLTAMEPVLIKTQGEVEEMIVNIDKDKKDAAETQIIVAAEEEAALAAESRLMAEAVTAAKAEVTLRVAGPST